MSQDRHHPLPGFAHRHDDAGVPPPSSLPAYILPWTWDQAQPLQSEWLMPETQLPPQPQLQPPVPPNAQYYPPSWSRSQCNVSSQDALYPLPNLLPSEAPDQQPISLSEASQPFVQDESVLAPLLPLLETTSSFPYMETITAPTPPYSSVPLPSPATPFYTPYSTFADLNPFSPNAYVSPAASLRSMPSTSRSSFVALPSPVASTSSTHPLPIMANYQYSSQGVSPMVTSPSSYFSLSEAGTPAFASGLSGYLPLPPESPVKEPAPLRRVSVPQPIPISPKRNSSATVRFRSGGTLGVRVQDVLSDAVKLDRRHELVLKQTGVRQIHLVIHWPGYDKQGKYISVQEEKGKCKNFISRERLAKMVCRQIELYWKDFSKKAPRLEHATWTISKSGGDGISIDKLWLLHVGPASGNVWKAEIEVSDMPLNAHTNPQA